MIPRYLHKWRSSCYSCEYFYSTHQCLKWDERHIHNSSLFTLRQNVEVGETIYSFKITVGIENWEWLEYSSKKNAEKTVKKVIHCQLKKMIQVKIKTGTINRTKSTKYATSDTVITNRSGHRRNSLWCRKLCAFYLLKRQKTCAD